MFCGSRRVQPRLLLYRAYLRHGYIILSVVRIVAATRSVHPDDTASSLWSKEPRVLAILPQFDTVQWDLSLASRSLLSALASSGRIGSAKAVAKRLGLSNRFQLARVLRRDAVPPLHRVTGWFTVLRWVDECERGGASLCRVAFASRKDPAGCYRL